MSEHPADILMENAKVLNKLLPAYEYWRACRGATDEETEFKAKRYLQVKTEQTLLVRKLRERNMPS